MEPQTTLIDFIAKELGNSGDFRNRIYFIGRRFGIQSLDIDDVTQDSFISAMNGAHTFNREPNDRAIKNWFAQIFSNRCIDFLRKRKRNLNGKIKGDSDILSLVSQEYEHPIIHLEDCERESIIKKSMDELPEKYKTVLTECYFNGLKYREVAEKLQIPISTVKSRLNCARKCLGNILIYYEKDLLDAA